MTKNLILLFLLFLGELGAGEAIKPKKIRGRGKPKIAKWEDVDATLTKLADQNSANKSISLLFRDIFSLDDATRFPLTNTVLKYTPESSLVNVPVFNKKGTLLGKFLNKYSYERSGGLRSKKRYNLVYFQYLNKNNEPETSGSGLLLDTFSVRWPDIKEHPGFSLAESETEN